MVKKQFRTSILIDDDEAPLNDLEYIQKRGLKPTNLLRKKIKELRAVDEGAPNVKLLMSNIRSMNLKMEKLFAFLEEKGLFKEFLKSQ